MEVTCSSETLVDFQRTAQRFIPEDRTLQVGVRFPVRARKFSLLHNVQIDSGDQPFSYTKWTEGCFPGGKAVRGVELTTHLHLVLMFE
jgi:hypothetical protein